MLATLTAFLVLTCNTNYTYKTQCVCYKHITFLKVNVIPEQRYFNVTVPVHHHHFYSSHR